VQRRRSEDGSDVLLRRGLVLYDFHPEEEDEAAVSKGETVEIEYEVGGWVQVSPSYSTSWHPVHGFEAATLVTRPDIREWAQMGAQRAPHTGLRLKHALFSCLVCGGRWSSKTAAGASRH
jgi:hypothetical protein